MPRPTSTPLPKVQRVLAELGQNIKLARQRRGLTAEIVADRAGMSRPTLRHIERGDPGVTLGSIANVLHALGLETDLAVVGRADELGRSLDDAALLAKPRTRVRQRGG